MRITKKGRLMSFWKPHTVCRWFLNNWLIQKYQCNISVMRNDFTSKAGTIHATHDEAQQMCREVEIIRVTFIETQIMVEGHDDLTVQWTQITWGFTNSKCDKLMWDRSLIAQSQDGEVWWTETSASFHFLKNTEQYQSQTFSIVKVSRHKTIKYLSLSAISLHFRAGNNALLTYFKT